MQHAHRICVTSVLHSSHLNHKYIKSNIPGFLYCADPQVSCNLQIVSTRIFSYYQFNHKKSDTFWFIFTFQHLHSCLFILRHDSSPTAHLGISWVALSLHIITLCHLTIHVTVTIIVIVALSLHLITLCHLTIHITVTIIVFNTHIISVALWCLTYATYNIYTIMPSSCTIIFVALTNYPYTHIWSYHVYSYTSHYSQHHRFRYSMSLSYYYAYYSYHYILLLVVSSTIHSCQVPSWINIHHHF